MKKANKILTALVAAALLATPFCIGSLAENAPTDEETIMADALKTLHLFQGRDDGYALDDVLTRAQAMTMLIRCIGAEEAALSSTTYTAPFKDVPDWAKPYVGYAYENGITKGAGDDIFLPDDLIPMNQFLTLLLRSLGYSESDDGFSWQEPYQLAEQIGIKDSAESPDEFDRGAMVKVCFRLLSATYVETGRTLASTLISQGVFNRFTYNSVISEAETLLEELKGDQPAETTFSEPETTPKPPETTPEPPETTLKPPVTTNDDGWTDLY